MTTTPTPVQELRCEHCFSETTTIPDPEWVSNDDIDGTTHGVECTNCSYTGWVIVEDQEITGFGGDMFPEPEHSSKHHGWREEPNVLYKEHYRFNDDIDLDEKPPSYALDFTNDEVLNGWRPTVTYECSCHFSFDSKTELAEHISTVHHNRGETAVR